MNNTKIFLGVLIAVFLAMGSAMAACTYNPACDDVVPGATCHWYDDSLGPGQDETTCCRDWDCNVLCTAPESGADLDVDGPTEPVTPGENAEIVIDLGEFGEDALNYKVYVILTHEFIASLGASFNPASHFGFNGESESPEVQSNGDHIYDLTSLIDGYNGGINGFLTGTNPAPGTVTITIPEDYEGETELEAVEVETSGGKKGTIEPHLPNQLTISSLPSGAALYDSVSDVEGNNPTSVSAVYTPNDEEFFIEFGGGDPAYAYFRFDMENYIYHSAWNLDAGGSNLALSVAPDSEGKGGYIVYDDGKFTGTWPTGLKKDVYVPAGDVPYAYCCPSATSSAGISATCTNMFVTFTTAEINEETYYVCAGMTGSGGATNGETNLTINDSAEGTTAEVGEWVEFYAHYYNKTSGAPLTDSNSDCKVNIEGTNYSMSYDSGDGRWDYNYTTGYSSSGTKNWQVWCNTTAAGHFDLTATDDVVIAGGETVPEFSDLGWILAAVLGGGGFILLRRKRSAF